MHHQVSSLAIISFLRELVGTNVARVPYLSTNAKYRLVSNRDLPYFSSKCDFKILNIVPGPYLDSPWFPLGLEKMETWKTARAFSSQRKVKEF